MAYTCPRCSPPYDQHNAGRPLCATCEGPGNENKPSAAAAQTALSEQAPSASEPARATRQRRRRKDWRREDRRPKRAFQVFDPRIGTWGGTVNVEAFALVFGDEEK
jgi:uncharacterized Zn finger protein (UPF0148 family)